MHNPQLCVGDLHTQWEHPKQQQQQQNSRKEEEFCLLKGRFMFMQNM